MAGWNDDDQASATGPGDDPVVVAQRRFTHFAHAPQDVVPRSAFVVDEDGVDPTTFGGRSEHAGSERNNAARGPDGSLDGIADAVERVEHCVNRVEAIAAAMAEVVVGLEARIVEIERASGQPSGPPGAGLANRLQRMLIPARPNQPTRRR